MLLSFYHHLVWLALIGNSSELSSFSTLSKLIMKPKPTASMKTPAEIKQLASFFVKPRLQVPRNESLIDWSKDTPEVQSSPTPHISPAGENMLSPRALLHNRDVKGKRRTNSIDSGPSLLNYGRNQPSIPSSWDGAHHTLSIFRIDETSEIDAINMAQSISRIIDYIKNNLVDKKSPAREFKQVTKGFWNLISAIYSSRWDLLPVEDGKNFCTLVGEKILNNYVKLGLVNQPEAKKPPSSMSTTAMNPNIPAIPPLSKTTGPNEKKAPKPTIMKNSYVQASKTNISSSIEDVIRVKEAFLTLSADEVGKMLKAKNSSEDTKKPKINMTTREQSRREVIIPMTKTNTELIINSAHIHISNINKCLKNSKSDIFADFIQFNVNGIIITTNKPASDLNLSTIEKYLKNIQNVNPDSIESPRLSESKSYMKIIRLPYSNKLEVMSPDIIKGVLKDSHLFKDVTLASKPRVIKASPKSDKTVVWVDIWDSQSGSCVKNIIN